MLKEFWKCQHYALRMTQAGVERTPPMIWCRCGDGLDPGLTKGSSRWTVSCAQPKRNRPACTGPRSPRAVMMFLKIMIRVCYPLRFDALMMLLHNYTDTRASLSSMWSGVGIQLCLDCRLRTLFKRNSRTMEQCKVIWRSECGLVRQGELTILTERLARGAHWISNWLAKTISICYTHTMDMEIVGMLGERYDLSDPPQAHKLTAYIRQSPWLEF